MTRASLWIRVATRPNGGCYAVYCDGIPTLFPSGLCQSSVLARIDYAFTMGGDGRHRAPDDYLARAQSMPGYVGAHRADRV